ncbi:MAG: hypothetical protein P9L90_06275 [Candidatus Aadella gelida]|nr:hypothetical protein [Candidatus Aadella gelida]
MVKYIFKKYGGSYQLKLENAEDLVKIQDIPEAHWAATSIPISSLNCDAQLLAFLDADNDGRILSADLKRAQAWLFSMLSDTGSVGGDILSLKLDWINVSHEEGERVQSAARFILKNLKLKDNEDVSLDQVREVKRIILEAKYNGDGVMPADCVEDEGVALLIKNIIETVGSTTDSGGKEGVSEKELDMFLNVAGDYLSWKGSALGPDGIMRTELKPFGDDTPQLYELVNSIKPKIEQFFTQCAMAGINESIIPAFGLKQEEIDKADLSDQAFLYETLKKAPLSSDFKRGVIDLEGNVNSYYSKQFNDLKNKVIFRVLGKSVKELDPYGWEKINGEFDAYNGWITSKKGGSVERLGEKILKEYLESDLKQKLRELIKKDLGVREEIEKINDVEKLILYQRRLLELANNFVSFTNLYNPNSRALFEAGTLVVDGRKMTFAMKVRNRQDHKRISERSNMFLLYLKITGKDVDDISFDVVVPVTSGFAGRLLIGKRGVFFAVDGREWDAEVVDILISPISIWESILVPFQKISEFFRGQAEKFNKSSQTKLEKGLGASSPSGTARDLLLGGSVAVAALGSSFAYITKAFSEVKASQVLLTIGSIALILFIPGLIMGIIKIRKRDMSIILEASGWAVNAQMRINSAMGKLFTHEPLLPEGSYREKFDTAGRFILEKKSFARILVYTVAAVVLLGVLGYYAVYFYYYSGK